MTVGSSSTCSPWSSGSARPTPTRRPRLGGAFRADPDRRCPRRSGAATAAGHARTDDRPLGTPSGAAKAKIEVRGGRPRASCSDEEGRLLAPCERRRWDRGIDLAERDLKAGDRAFAYERSARTRSETAIAAWSMSRLDRHDSSPSEPSRHQLRHRGARCRPSTARSPSSTPASAASPCCTSASSRCRRRTSSTSATTRGSPTARAAPRSCGRHVEQVSRFLLERGAKLLVIACNSAASAGLEVAREVAGEQRGGGGRP